MIALKKSIIVPRRILVYVLFILLLWIPNLYLFFSLCPYLKTVESLQASPLVRKTGIFIDVAKYYACANIARSNPEHIWDTTAQQNWFKNYLKIPETLDLYAHEKLSPAQYTPQSICLFMLFCGLPLNVVIIITAIIYSLAMIIPVTILIRKNCELSTYEIIFWWLMFLAATPVAENYVYGQTDCIIAGLAAIYLLTWQNKNSIPAAFALASTIALKPQHSLVLLVMAIASKKKWLLFFTGLISTIFLLVTIMVLGPKAVFEYPHHLISIEKSIDNYQMPAPTSLVISVLAPVAIVFGRHIARLIALPFSLVCIIGIYLIWQKAIKAGTTSYNYAYASSLLLNFICGPHEHFYDLTLLCVMWAATVPAVKVGKIQRLKPFKVRMWCFLFLLFAPITSLIVLSCPPQGYFGCRYLPVLFIMFVIALANFNEAAKQAKG